MPIVDVPRQQMRDVGRHDVRATDSLRQLSKFFGSNSVTLDATTLAAL